MSEICAIVQFVDDSVDLVQHICFLTEDLPMKKAQQGFTLIELVMVIVILGVLAAVAIPKFIDLKSDAASASVNGVAGALSSGSAINYSIYTAKGTSGSTAGTGTVKLVNSCDAAKLVLQGGAFPSGGGTYTAPTATFTSTAADPGAVNSCTLTFTPSSGSVATASFTAIAVP